MQPLPTFDLEAMRNVDIRTVDPSSLVDIRDVNIDANLPVAEKATSYIEQIRNPYCFRHGDMIVKVNHSQTPVTINDCMEGFYRSL